MPRMKASGVKAHSESTARRRRTVEHAGVAHSDAPAPGSRAPSPEGPVRRILGQPIAIAILHFLWRRKGRHTGRGIARELGSSESRVARVLKELTANGLVRLEVYADRFHTHWLNHAHWLIRHGFLPIFQLEEQFFPLLGRAVEGAGDPYVQAVIYLGDASREPVPGETIHLQCIIGNRNAQALVESLLRTRESSLRLQFGHPLSYEVLSIEEFHRRKRESPRAYAGRTIAGSLPSIPEVSIPAK
jgi:hypothetical protein